MPISFFDFRDGQGWEPIQFDADDPNNYWDDNGVIKALEVAPFDFAATLKGALEHSTKVETAFQWRGRQLAAGRTLPKHHHNVRQLMVVVGGALSVEYGANGEDKVELGPDEFWIAEAGTPYTLTAGPEGAIYLESWDAPLTTIENYWHDDANWVHQ
jgi:mannose-6-phosphate isomerase-like protein (cupin superfamily)